MKIPEPLPEGFAEGQAQMLCNLAEAYEGLIDSMKSYDKFWDTMYEGRLSIMPQDREEFIMGFCGVIAMTFQLLGKDDPSVEYFLSVFPFYLPVDYHGWPPTPEWIRHLMT